MVENVNDSLNEIENSIDENKNTFSNDENQPQNCQEEEYDNELLDFVFKVTKLGKRGFSHKTRILRITNEGICYYKMVEKNNETSNFIETLNNLYITKKNNNYDQQLYNEMIKLFRKLPSDQLVLKNYFRNYKIEKNPPISSFNQAPFKVTNLDIEENKREEAGNFWIMEATHDAFRRKIIKSKEYIREVLEKRRKKKEEDEKIKTMQQKVKKNENVVKTDGKVITLFKDKIKYIGLLYQGFLKEYFEFICGKNTVKEKAIRNYERGFLDKNEKKNPSSKYDNVNINNTNNNNSNFHKNADMNEKAESKKQDYTKIDHLIDCKYCIKKVYLELAIYYCYNLFVTHCEEVVKKIVQDLGKFHRDDVKKQDKLKPIVFPSPYYYTQEDTAVLLYNIWGINYTLTWHNLNAIFKNTVTTSKGKWKKLKHQFQQKNYLQDLLCKLALIAEDTDNFPNIPLSCIIDYNGFRVYCESDIFVNEEYLEGMKIQFKTQTDDSNVLLKKFMELISECNNSKYSKVESMNYFCTTTGAYISNELGFKLKDYVTTMIEDFLETLKETKETGSNKSNNETNKKNNNNDFKPHQGKFKNCFLLYYKDIKDDMKDKIEYSDFKDQSINFQLNCSYNYLLYFDVLVSISWAQTELYFRQELIINSIDLDKEIEELHPKYIEQFAQKINDINKTIIGPDEDIVEVPYKYSARYTELESPRKSDSQKKLYSYRKKNKTPNELIYKIISDNTEQNNIYIAEDLKQKFDKNFKYLLMALDSLYLIPYNSETLKICFHYYGINLHYLGKVAEETSVPHVREICLIEMFARVCKKIIFDLMGQSTFEKAMKIFYSNIREIPTELTGIPSSFNIEYGSDYLKSTMQPIENMKAKFSRTVEKQGLNLQNDKYPFEDAKEDKDKKDINEQGNEKYQKINNFLSMIFGGGNSNKIEFDIYGTKINNSIDLWKYIIELI